MDHEEREGYWQGVLRRGKLIGLALLVYAAVGSGVFSCLVQRKELAARQAKRLVTDWYSSLSGTHTGGSKRVRVAFAALHSQWITSTVYGKVRSYYVESVHASKSAPTTVRLSVVRRDRLQIEEVEVEGEVISRIEIALPMSELRNRALPLPDEGFSMPQ